MTNLLALIAALVLVESHGDLRALRDDTLAAGPLQIRPIYVEDVNRIAGTSYQYPDDCWSMSNSVAMFRIYVGHYATAKRIGREPTLEDMARIHYGGPRGWRWKSTKQYWHDVQDAHAHPWKYRRFPHGLRSPF